MTSAVYVHYSASYSCLLVRHEPHRVLCRSLAGVNQRITLPLFYTVIILQIISSSLIVTGPLYHNWVGMSSVYCTLFHSFLRVFYCSPPTFPCRYNTFIITYYPDLSRGESERWCPQGWMYGFNNAPVPRSVLAYYFGLLTQVSPLRTPT